MESRIVGTTLPVLELSLDAGESVLAEPGELGWIGASIALTTSTRAAGAKSLFGAAKRALGGGGLFMTQYEAQGAPGLVAFPTKLPGQILPVDVAPGQGYLVHHHGFLCGESSVELTMAFQRSIGAGVFGGEGFILQKIGGTAKAWVELSGEVVSRDLQEGETLRVHPGHVGMFEERVRFDLVRLPGLRNVVFGGEDFFLAALTGPGKVWLQSLTLPGLAHALQPYLASAGTAGGAVAGGLAGAVMKGFLGR